MLDRCIRPQLGRTSCELPFLEADLAFVPQSTPLAVLTGSASA